MYRIIQREKSKGPGQEGPRAQANVKTLSKHVFLYLKIHI